MGALKAALVLLLAALAAAPPAGGEEPVTPAEAEAWLSALERAYAREDLAAVLDLAGPEELKRLARIQVGRLFAARNYLQLSHSVLETEPRPDGSLEVEVIEVLRSRPAEARSDRREKSRRRHRLERRDGRVLLVDRLDARQPQLPPVGRFAPELWTGRLVLEPEPRQPFASPSGTARVALRVRLRNVSPAAGDELSFGLHPFVRELELSLAGGVELAPVRHEGAADVWTLRLPAPVAAGATVELSVRYALDEVGDGAHARIGPDGAHLFPESAWHPLFPPTGIAGLERAQADLVVDVPAGWKAVAPGTLTRSLEREDGRGRFRWASRFPADGLSVVAGELDRYSVPLTDELDASIWRQAGRPAPRELGETLRGIVRHLETVLGPAPAPEVSVVETLTPGLRHQPGFYALGDFDLAEAELFVRERERQPQFFLAHHLAHLWMVDAVRPIGGPAQVLSEALCDHLAFDWTDAALDPRISQWHRDRILQQARARPAGDGPLLAARPGEPGGEVFGRGKALVVLDGFRAFAGRERWAALLSEHVRAHRGQEVGASDLLAALGASDARLEDYLATWLVGQGWADLAVSEPRARELVDELTGATRFEVEIEIANEGLGPVPVLLRTLEDRRGAEWREQQLELGTRGRTIVRLRLDAPLRAVELDPWFVTWQSDVRNDAFPEKRRKPKSLPGQERVVTEDEQRRLEELLRGG